MAEIRIFYREENRLKMSKDIEILKEVPMDHLLWIDLNDMPEETESRLEQFLKIYIQEEEEMEEIEISSRYMETENSLVANSRFLLKDYDEEIVSFIVKDNILVSVVRIWHRLTKRRVKYSLTHVTTRPAIMS